MRFDDKPLSKAQREHHYYLAEAMGQVEFDLHHRIYIDRRIPNDWHRIASERSQKKSRVTLRLDEDVVKFFRSMGPGYGPRINETLRAFMHARLMGLLDGDETIDQFRRQDEEGPHERPDWGHFDKRMSRRKPD